MAVTTTSVAPQEARQTVEYTGRVRGSRTAQVRARVSGILEERLYDEGEHVSQGDSLFRIDPEPLELALQGAEADHANATASLRQAERSWNRISQLFEEDAVSEGERDQARTELELAEARAANTETAVAQAQLELSYSEVTAPIDGIAGEREVSLGNLIEYGDLLTTIIQHDPVYVHFSPPADDAEVQRGPHGTAGAGESTLTVRARLGNGSRYEHEGTVNFTDNSVDPQTNSVPMRASFPNPQRQLMPGQIVRVEMVLRRFTNAFLIDPAAISEGPEGPRVFIVEQNTAHATPVTLGPLIGDQRVITQGLEAGERLVIEGHVALQDQSPVRSAADAQEGR